MVRDRGRFDLEADIREVAGRKEPRFRRFPLLVAQYAGWVKCDSLPHNPGPETQIVIVKNIVDHGPSGLIPRSEGRLNVACRHVNGGKHVRRVTISRI